VIEYINREEETNIPTQKFLSANAESIREIQTSLCGWQNGSGGRSPTWQAQGLSSTAWRPKKDLKTSQREHCNNNCFRWESLMCSICQKPICLHMCSILYISYTLINLKIYEIIAFIIQCKVNSNIGCKFM
jgi:hypothetical protein